MMSGLRLSSRIVQQIYPEISLLKILYLPILVIFFVALFISKKGESRGTFVERSSVRVSGSILLVRKESEGQLR